MILNRVSLALKSVYSAGSFDCLWLTKLIEALVPYNKFTESLFKRIFILLVKQVIRLFLLRLCYCFPYANIFWHICSRKHLWLTKLIEALVSFNKFTESLNKRILIYLYFIWIRKYFFLTHFVTLSCMQTYFDMFSEEKGEHCDFCQTGKECWPSADSNSQHLDWQPTWLPVLGWFVLIQCVHKQNLLFHKFKCLS